MTLREDKLFIFALTLLMLLPNSYGFVRSFSSLGTNYRWAERDATQLELSVVTDNNDSISKESVEAIVGFSIRQWSNNQGDVAVTWVPGTNEPGDVDGQNDLYFTSEDIFGSGVLAITVVAYLPATGRLVEADIIVNDRISYSADASDTKNVQVRGGSYFLGDVLTHEMGHFFGLSHGQVHGSTMTFTVFKGQFSTASDDREGLNGIYPLDHSTRPRGGIRGIVAGSDNRIGIFGAHVQAISENTGKVIAAAATDDSGRFNIPSLPLGDTYYLYVSSLNKEAGLPKYYKTIKTEFCPGRRSWQGAYFSKCGNGAKGMPQGITLSQAGAVRNAETLSIRCEFELPSGHTPNNNGRGGGAVGMMHSNGSVGAAVTGIFKASDIAANSSELILNNSQQRKSNTYTIDLTGYAPDATKDLYLDIKIVAQGTYSLLRTNVHVSNVNSYAALFPATFNTIAQKLPERDQESNSHSTTYDLDHFIHVPLDETTAANNSFTVEVIPQPLCRGRASQSCDKEFFPSASLLASPVAHYLMILTISEKNGSEYSIIEQKNHDPFTSNLACMDGPRAYRVEANVGSDSEANSAQSKRQLNRLFCGATSDLGSGGGPGNGNPLLMLVVTMLMVIRVKMGKKSGFSL